MTNWLAYCTSETPPGHTPGRLYITLAAGPGAPLYCLTCQEVVLEQLQHSGHNVKGLAAADDDGRKMLSLIEAAIGRAA